MPQRRIDPVQEIDGAASGEFVGNHFLHGRDELPHPVAAIDGACIMHDFAEPLKFLGGKCWLTHADSSRSAGPGASGAPEAMKIQKRGRGS
jgi:hypothetical protein